MVQRLKEQASGNKGVALKAGVWYVISSILVRMISVITTPIFTRLLSTEEYGIVSTFSSWYSMFLIIYTLNLNISIGRAKLDYPDKLEDYIGSMQLLSLIVSLIISGILAIFIKPISEFLELPIMATGFLLIYLIASPSISFYQSGYRYNYQYKQNIGIAWYVALSTVCLSLLLIYLVDYNNAVLRIAGLVAPYVVLAFIFWFLTFKNKHAKFSMEYWKYGLKISLPMILHSISLSILSQSNRIIISKNYGNEIVALFSLVQNYASLLMVVTDAINQGWQPWFHDNYDVENDSVKRNANFLTVLLCYIGLACVAIGPEAVYILGGKPYMEAVACVPPLIAAVICQCLYTHYINIEIHLKKTKYAAIGTIVAAILNVGINLFVIPCFGYIASAYVTFGCYCVLLILHWVITTFVLKSRVYNNKFILISMTITAMICFLLTLTYDYLVVRWVIIAVGFLSFLFVFRRFILNIIKNMKNRFVISNKK